MIQLAIFYIQMKYFGLKYTYFYNLNSSFILYNFVHISLKNTSLKTKEMELVSCGIAVYDEISNWEKINVKDSFKARSGAKQALCYQRPSWNIKKKKKGKKLCY